MSPLLFAAVWRPGRRLDRGRNPFGALLHARVRTRYRQELDVFGMVRVVVEFDTWRDEITDYSLVLTVRVGEFVETVRVYDGTHGRNEMHRYTKELGKQPGEVFHRGTLGEGMRAAQTAVRYGYEEMIDGWRRG